MIVEVEAYCGVTDRAAHSYGGRRTARNEVTYGPGGHAYVFFVYGMYYQLNVVTRAGRSSARTADPGRRAGRRHRSDACNAEDR